MIRKVRVENYKSIPDLALDLGRVTVLIGANGSGKSNILEAIALASAAEQDKLDNEFLTSRGIRVTQARLMRSAFDKTPTSSEAIKLSYWVGNERTFACELTADETASYLKWNEQVSQQYDRDLSSWLKAENLTPGTPPATPEYLDRCSPISPI
jgi:AAA15 family ATPase/GTPase